MQGLGDDPSQPQSYPRRPGTSRPGTSRPGTSFGQDQGDQEGYYYPYGQQQQHFQYVPEEGEYFEEEESDDEDVFAFLPPSTAEAAKEAQEEQQRQLQQEQAGEAEVGAATMTASQQPMYYYSSFQPHLNNPFAYPIASGNKNNHDSGAAASAFVPAYDAGPQHAPFTPPESLPPPTAGVLSPTTMSSSMENVEERGAHNYQPMVAPVVETNPYPLGPPPLSPPASDSQPSTGYGMQSMGGGEGEVVKLEKMRSPAVPPALGELEHEEEGGINEEKEKRDEETKVVSQEVDLGADNIELGGDTREGDVERGRGGRKSRRKSARKSAGGEGARPVTAVSTEGGVLTRKRSKNPNAGPYLNYSPYDKWPRKDTATSRVTTSPTSPTSGTTVINESIHSGSFPLASRRRRSQILDSAGGQTESDDGYLRYRRGHDGGADSIGESSYAGRQKMRREDDESMVGSFSLKGELTEDEEDGEDGESIKMEFDFDTIDEEDSPYPEVRASVSNIDDTEMPALTIRMWFVGLLLCMTSSALNVFFNLRNPAPAVIPLALLLISYPIGKFLAYIMPIRTFRIKLPHLPRSWFPLHQPSFAPFRLITNLLLPLTYDRAFEFSLNPGPWNIKEHVLVYIMANVVVSNPYALNAIIVAEKYYKIPLDYWFSLTLILATQLTGFGLAGMTRRFLVTPASMVWPQNLVCCTLLNTLHAEDEDDGIGVYGVVQGEGGKAMSRYRFFILVTFGSFLWWFLPGYLFKALSTFSFVCWVAPFNVPLNQAFGVENGLGMSFLTFDWTRISWIGSPLMVPWWAEVNIFVGFVLFFWVLVPALYYSNAWQLAYFPMIANSPYDRFGSTYNVSRVLTTNDRFDEAAYFAYSPLYLPATYAMTYLLAFTLSTCIIVHTLLYHGRHLYNGILKIRIEEDDIHAKLMKAYKEVPDWWYAIGFASFFGLAVVAVEVWHTGIPVWSLVLAVALPILYILPNGFIFAMTGQAITINLLAQIIPGTLLPGSPFANMVFKAYAVQTLAAATSFVQDLKLGHYIKVPPRATFLVQMIGTTLAAFIQVGVKRWIFAHIPDVCSPNQKFYLTCPYNQVFFTASAIWGLIGPARQFGTGSIYHPHLYAIIVGVFLPIPFWLYQRKYPNSWVRYVSIPVIITGVSKIPPATGINYSSWFLVGFFFQFVIRRKNFAWWGKFNYVLSSALDSGSVIGVIFIFFTLQFPVSREVRWWGNTVFEATADHERLPWLNIPSGGLPWRFLKPTATATSVLSTATAVVQSVTASASATATKA